MSLDCQKKIAFKVDDYLGEHPDVTTLTAMFFFLNFLAATQDIAVDGWALTMLQVHVNQLFAVWGE